MKDDIKELSQEFDKLGANWFVLADKIMNLVDSVEESNNKELLKTYSVFIGTFAAACKNLEAVGEFFEALEQAVEAADSE